MQGSNEERIGDILNGVCNDYKIDAILIADREGFPVAGSTGLKAEAIAAVAPEYMRMGEKIFRYGNPIEIHAVTLLLKDGQMILIRDIDIGVRTFVLVVYTRSIDSEFQNIFPLISRKVSDIMNY